MKYLYIDCCPIDEKCYQVGQPDHLYWNKIEYQVFEKMLNRLFPVQTFLVFLIQNKNQHDFGPYINMAIAYDEEDKAVKNAAFFIANNHPDKWDQEALQELKNANHPLYLQVDNHKQLIP